MRIWSNNQFVIWAADLNCEAPPNVLGKDVFNIADWESNKKLSIPRLFTIKDETTRKAAIERCKSFSYGSGVPSPCFAVFVYDGWQFKDDYPW